MSDTKQLFFPLLEDTSKKQGKTIEKLKRLDIGERRKDIVQYCRLDYGDVWEDPVKGHRVGVLDATKADDVHKLLRSEKANLVINDPPYNVKVGNANTRNLSKISIEDYISFSKQWVMNTLNIMQEDSHLYIWIGTNRSAYCLSLCK